MKIRALKSNFGDNGHIRRGQIIDVVDEKAQQLIKRGIFVSVQAGESAPAKTETKAPAKSKAVVRGKAKPSGESQVPAVDPDLAAAAELDALDDEALRAVAASENAVVDEGDDKANLLAKIAKARSEK